MPWQTIKINSAQIKFDRERTKEHRTDFNKPCECLECRNYYKHIENNIELVEFLSGFGVDYNCTEEVFSWKIENNRASLIHHEAYYGIYGKIEGEELYFEKFGVKIAFVKNESFPHDRVGEYFWICIEGDFPYLHEGKREKSSFVNKIKSILKAVVTSW